jgi:hypothetical protein
LVLPDLVCDPDDVVDLAGQILLGSWGFSASVDTSKPATTWTGKTGHHGIAAETG